MRGQNTTVDTISKRSRDHLVMRRAGPPVAQRGTRRHFLSWRCGPCPLANYHGNRTRGACGGFLFGASKDIDFVTHVDLNLYGFFCQANSSCAFLISLELSRAYGRGWRDCAEGVEVEIDNGLKSLRYGSITQVSGNPSCQARYSACSATNTANCHRLRSTILSKTTMGRSRG
jgi:hypothetical protein